jgi:hypothetical protein
LKGFTPASDALVGVAGANALRHVVGWLRIEHRSVPRSHDVVGMEGAVVALGEQSAAGLVQRDAGLGEGQFAL